MLRFSPSLISKTSKNGTVSFLSDKLRTYSNRTYSTELFLSGKVKYELRVARDEFRYTSYKFKSTSYEFKFTSYEFKSTS